MATSPLLYASQDIHPVLDMAQPIRIGPAITGTISITSSLPNHASVYSGVKIEYANLNTETNTVYVFPIFPTGTIPRRFIFEASFSLLNFSSNDFIYFFIGTPESGSSTMNAMGFSLDGLSFATIANGVFSASSANFGSAWYTNSSTGTFFIKKEFEFRTQTFATGSDVVFRCRECTSSDEENGTYQYDGLYKSSPDFPWQKFPAAWNGKTFNKIFLGVSSPFGSSGEINMDLFRVKKHIMDWDS